MAFWIYGVHAIQAALNNTARRCLQMAYLPRVDFKFDRNDIEMIEVDKSFFDKKFGPQAVHQGLALYIEPISEIETVQQFVTNTVASSNSSYIIILDQITDPHNVGAIVRTAAAMGATAIITTHHQSVNRHSPILYKTASGAMEHIKIFQVVNLNQTIQMLKDHQYWIVGLDETGSSTLHHMDLNGHYGLILGAEGKGMRRLLYQSCDFVARLPTSSAFSTLNVSNANAIACYTFYLKQNHLDNN